MDLITIAEPKFKTASMMFMLLVPVMPEKNAAYALALSLLTQSCRKYPDNAAMTVALDNMYGASLNSSVSLNGSVMQLIINGSTIANRYALEGEDLAAQLTELICGCILDPNVRDGAFIESEYRIERQELLDAIDAEINNKRGYALLRARRTAFCGEPDAYPVYGTKEDVEQLTPASVYEAYREILRRAVIRVYFVAPEMPTGLDALLRERFSGVERAPEELRYFAPSPIKPAPENVTEPMDVTQSKLVMVFKAHDLNYEAFKMLSAVFGGTPFSLLFSNVREKESLCYYCASRVIAGKDTLIVDSGVELANADRTREAVLEQLAALCSGDFPEELIDHTKLAMVSALRSIGDTPSSCIFEQYERFFMQDDADVETRVQRYLALTKEQIVDAARALTLDTVYLMQQGGNGSHD